MEDVFQLCLFVVKEIASGTPLAFQVLSEMIEQKLQFLEWKEEYGGLYLVGCAFLCRIFGVVEETRVQSKMFRFQQSFKVTFIPGCRESQQNAHVKAVLDEVRPTLYRLNDPKIVF
jgi:hypothetical protein